MISNGPDKTYAQPPDPEAFYGDSMYIADQFHYHIRWSHNGALDWEPFASQGEARGRAEEVRQADEDYTIEKLGETCSQCARSSNKIAGSRQQ
jgi:hypothetical protein